LEEELRSFLVLVEVDGVIKYLVLHRFWRSERQAMPRGPCQFLG